MQNRTGYVARSWFAAIIIGASAVGFVSSPAAAADGNSDALADLRAAVARAPQELNVSVDWEAMAEYSPSDLDAITDSIPTDVEFVLEEEKAAAPTAIAARSLAAVSAAAATKGCKDGGATLYFKGGVTKAKLWRLKQSVHFCWDYGKRTVTSISTPEVEGYVYGPGKASGWKYRGIKNGPTNTAHRDTYGIANYTSFVQAQFELCPPRIACTIEVNPWIRVNTFRDGSVSSTKGGER